MSSISEYLRDLEVSKVQMLCDKPECYAIRFEDGSAMLVNAKGDRIKSPLDNYDFITNVQYIGQMNGMPHFAYSARDWATRHICETGIFDVEGHRKLFRDPCATETEGVDSIKEEFQRLEKMAKDPSNPRRNDPFLVDLDEPRQSMRIGR